jgi:uncharacterized protein YjbI with pentapeptide repeats
VAEFVCGIREKNPDYLSACKDLPEYQDTGYCVLHFPGEEKTEDFEQVKKDKLEQQDYDFGGAIFPDGTSNFERYEFDADVNFTGATFVGKANFQEAQFSGEWTSFQGAQFSGAETSFREAQFSGEWTTFSLAQFSGEWRSFNTAQFSSARTTFEGAQFSGEWTHFLATQFESSDTSFLKATFAKEVYFSGVTFSEKVTFWGTQGNRVFGPGAWAHFDRPRIEKPEQFTFNTVLLHPGWFINADVRKVDFTDVQWYGLSHEILTLKKRVKEATEAFKLTERAKEGTEALKKRELKQAWEALKKIGLKQAWDELTTTGLDNEIGELEARTVSSPHTLLAQACRRLSANAEENREYPLANEFHYWSMDALRKQGWLTLGLIGTMYWALSGYGVRATRAFVVLVGICAAFAALYMVFGPPKLEDLGQALVYSLGAVARLNPEPRPTEPGLFQFLVIVEGLLGPLQIALLALAIRRKVMR